MKTSPLALVFLTLLTAAVAAGLRAAPADAREITELKEQLRQLAARLEALEQRQAASPPAPAAPEARVTASDRGVSMGSADGANAVRLRGLVQADSRWFFGDGGAGRDAFVLRRARIIAEGVLARNFSFQLVSEFGGSSTSILDANVNVALTPALQVRAGKFKVPVGMELLQSDTWTFLNERSIVTNLVPGRDLGVQAWGDLAGGRVQYAVGVFNGVPDGATTTNTDFDNEKDVAGRVWLSPFRADRDSPLRGLSFGLAGSAGRQQTAAGRTSGYRTDGQQAFFSYLPGVVADGRTWRVSPQFDFRSGPFGLLGEYVVSGVAVRPASGVPVARLRHDAWQLAAGYVLTGEDSAPTGVSPRTNLSVADGTWGAFELTGRIARVDVDDAAFPLLASAASSASEATAFGLGLNWYLSKAAALKLSYYQTAFDLARGAPAVPASPLLRQDEKAFITRLQLGF